MAGKFWREAASLMVVGKAANMNSKVARQDFQLLFLRRNQNSSFLPSSYVFPGGVIDSSDFSKDWLDIFKKYGYESSDLLTNFRNAAPPPDIYINKSYDVIPEVGFRIGAIREAFEECGLLLAHHLPNKHLNRQELSKWQQIVHQDASQFVVMFQELGGCPAIWNLHEWVTWLTPAHLGGHRFNTAFFITFMDKIPQIHIDDKEIVDVKVLSPIEMLKLWKSKSVVLPPPQVYEVSRFLNFTSYRELEEFAQERSRKGMDTLFPVRTSCSNGILICLPGDDLYPEEPDYTGEQRPLVSQESLEELRKISKNFNRMEMKGQNKVNTIINISPKYGQKSVGNIMESLKSEE